MIPIDKILGLARYNSAPYSDLISDKVYKDVSKGHRDVNVIIGIRGRSSFLSTCIRYFKRAIEGSDLKVNITIVEQDSSSHYKDTCKSLGLDYIFIPRRWLKRIEKVRVGNPKVWLKYSDHCPLFLETQESSPVQG